MSDALLRLGAGLMASKPISLGPPTAGLAEALMMRRHAIVAPKKTEWKPPVRRVVV